jgi:hypothetical protein
VTAATGTLIHALIQADDRGRTSAATGVLAAGAVGSTRIDSGQRAELKALETLVLAV